MTYIIIVGLGSVNRVRRGELPLHERLSQLDNKSKATSSSGQEQYSLDQFHRIIDIIKFMRHRANTRLQYHRIWTSFNKFLIKFDRMPATWEDRVYIWVAHLVDNRKSVATVKSYLSAIRQILSSDGVELNEDKALLSSLLTTCKLKNKSLFIRLPIRLKLLQRVIHHTDLLFKNCGQYYLATLLKAMFSTAYFGLLRVGELVQGDHQMKAENVHLARNKNKLIILLTSSKTHTPQDAPQRIEIPAIPQLGKNCPLKLLENFMKIRESGSANNALFTLPSGIPITAQMFRTWLRRILANIGVNCKLYNSHSFRAGRCLDLRKLGFSLRKVKEAGRWLSSAILKYLKMDKI